MDASHPTPTEPSERPADNLVRGLRDKRRRLQKLLSSQRDQFDSLEYGFEQQVSQLREELARQQTVSSVTMVDTGDIEAQRTALATEAESLARLSTELEGRQAELLQVENRLKEQERSTLDRLAQQQAALDERTAELDAAGAQIRQAQRAIAASEDELTADRELVVRTRERLDEQLQAIEQQREELASLKSETNNQRRRIARELQQQRTAQKDEMARGWESLRRERDDQLADINRRHEEVHQQAESDHSEIMKQLAGAHDEAEDLRRQIFDLKKQLNARSEELSSARGEHAQVLEELDLSRFEHSRLSQQVAIRQRVEDDDQSEQTRVRAELETLRSKLAEAEKLAANGELSEADSRKREDSQRRFELAIEDIRDLKRRNALLEDQLAAAGESGGSGGGRANEGKLDWESQKRRLLASLEADGDDEDEERTAERMSIEGTIRITDEIVNRKDRELAELKQVLEEQSSNLGTVAVGASAIASMLDQDSLIQQERENLQRLQTEWREKLRQAEIDISVERARMARERAELDDKLQAIAADRARHGSKEGGGKPDTTGKPAERRWWARLGLKDGEH